MTPPRLCSWLDRSEGVLRVYCSLKCSTALPLTPAPQGQFLLCRSQLRRDALERCGLPPWGAQAAVCFPFPTHLCLCFIQISWLAYSLSLPLEGKFSESRMSFSADLRVLSTLCRACRVSQCFSVKLCWMDEICECSPHQTNKPSDKYQTAYPVLNYT